VGLKHSGSISKRDMRELTDEELMAIIHSGLGATPLELAAEPMADNPRQHLLAPVR
jgi:hypothetical protein